VCDASPPILPGNPLFAWCEPHPPQPFKTSFFPRRPRGAVPLTKSVMWQTYVSIFSRFTRNSVQFYKNVQSCAALDGMSIKQNRPIKKFLFWGCVVFILGFCCFYCFVFLNARIYAPPISRFSSSSKHQFHTRSGCQARSISSPLTSTHRPRISSRLGTTG
jgi:hypothetical protein